MLVIIAKSMILHCRLSKQRLRNRQLTVCALAVVSGCCCSIMSLRMGNRSEKVSSLPEWIEKGKAPKEISEWCRTLQRHPRPRPHAPLYGECGRSNNKILCDDGKPMFFGHKNEDLYTWWTHFRFLNRPGVFIDLAANDPVMRSNTFFYERCLQWRGVCIEANPRYFGKLSSIRTCALVKRCVSDIRRNVTYIDSKGSSGVLETNRNWFSRRYINRNRRSIQCIPTQEALHVLGEAKIDFMSLDIEGHELQALKGMDWSKTKIDVIVTENQGAPLKNYLESLGYEIRNMERDEHGSFKEWSIRSDRLFVHKTVQWGSPV